MSSLAPALIGVALCLSALFFGIFLLTILRRSRAPRRVNPAAYNEVPVPTRGSGEGPLFQAPSVLDEPSDTLATPAPAALPYSRRRYLLTQAEREFFDVLRAATPPGWYVFPQVRLANLVMLQKGTRNWKPHFSRVAQKCVDFVLCDSADISPQLVVELDDSSHDRPDRQDRDAFVDAALASAGLPILHVRWRRRYDAEELAAAIRRAAGLPAISLLPVALPAQAPMRAAPREPLSPAMLDPAQSAPPASRCACRQCGGEVSMTAKFCPGCGATLEL